MISYRLAYWFSLPWCCRLLGHRTVIRESFNENVLFTPEESWFECERCGHFGGYA